MNLEQAREQIRELDRDLLRIAAARIRLAREIAALKAVRDLPTVDYTQERRVLERAARVARREGLDPDLAADLVAALLRASVEVQESQRLRQAAAGEGRHAVVAGGAGRMGRWVVEFLRAQGYRVDVLDPAAPAPVQAAARKSLAGTDLVVCATPPSVTARLYREWLEHPPGGRLCDIASIKTPLLGPIRALRREGRSVGSFHPLFGPDAMSLRECDVVLCDTGDDEARRLLEELFAPTSARVVRIPIQEHDRLMADALSLAHLTALAFAGAATAAEPAAADLRSTTYRALERLATRVVRESPGVYFEIQADNPHSREAVERLGAALEEIWSLVEARDQQGFATWMERAARRLTRDPAGR